MKISRDRKLLIWATLSVFFVFMLESKTFATTQFKLLASDAAAGDEFDESISINGDVALVGGPEEDTGSGSAYVYALEVPPGKATLNSPSGTITENKPTYTWNAVANSTWYYLWVNDDTGNMIKKWYTASQANCGGDTSECSVTDTTVLADGSCKWWIQTWNDYGYGPWSDAMAFGVDTGTDAACKDVCLLGETRNQDGKSCQLWDAATSSWLQDVSVGPGHLHNRARAHLAWLYNWHLAAGGVVGSRFQDATLAALREYASQSDSAGNTGVFLASEALRSMVTGSPHAQQSLIQTVQVLHDWWNVSGDPGYLARFAAPVDTDDPIAAQTFETDNDKDHYNKVYNNELWNWRGHVSRDQYAGVMMGYSLAYEATNDEVTRALIREDVVEFIEQLMRRDVVDMRIQVNDISLPMPLEVELQYMVFSDDDTENGLPTIMVNTDELTDIHTLGFQLFWPDIGEVVSQIPGFHWVKTLPNPTVAVQLTSHFLVALQVTEGIPEYASRRATILDFYERHVDDWLDIADKWRNTNRCGEKYYGNIIVFLPMYNLVRLEYNPDRAARIRNDILRDRLWYHVAEHKNVFFAHIYASNADPADPIQDITFSHAQQLDLFPPPPLQDLPKDLTDLYPPWEGCPGRSEIATDLDDRLIEYFLWQKDPFELISEGEVGKVNPGHDFLVAYWMGRKAGFIDDDAPNTCLAWR